MGCVSSSTQTHTVISTSIADKLNGEWKIYPNPVNGNKLIVEAPGPLGANVKIILLDANGRRILEADQVREQRTVINLPENMQPGTYLIKIFGERVYSTDILVR